MKWSVYVLAGGLLAFIGLSPFVVSWAKANRLPVRRSSLEALLPGSTQEEVKRRLGDPRQIWSDNQTWSYSAPPSRFIVYILFDTNYLYRGYELDD